MAILIPPGLTDDNDFVASLNAIIAGASRLHSPSAVWVIHVDNWFDHKWLRFSGNGAVGADVTSFLKESVKKSFWQDGLTFPPFSPERITEQWSFGLSGGEYVELPLPSLPQRGERSATWSNLNRRIENWGVSALYVWYSGNTLKNQRGSIMLYCIGESAPICWFASFHNHKGPWVVDKTKDVSREHVMKLLAGE
jgi:hypothetical protein